VEHGTRRDISLADLNHTQFVPFKVYDVTLERRRPRGRPRDGVAKVSRKQLRITFDMRIDVVDDARGGDGRSLPKKWSPCPCVMKIVVSVLPVLATISPSASTSSLISSASTRTASRAPKISVDVVGENVRLGSPAITRTGLVNTRSSSEDRWALLVIRDSSDISSQGCAISRNPSPSGSLRTSQGVLKYMVARCSAVYVSQCGRPS
jgi:hypothetical protein